MEEPTSLSAGRSKRQKIDKTGRFAALQRLKSLKGSKNKCEIGELENVYDEVDEKEYSKKVLERQEDDWIEDDGSGYVEDGREIFDDELEEDIRSSKKTKGCKRKAVDKSSNIKSLFANMPIKKKVSAPVKAEDDEILGDLMEEINDSKPIEKKEISSKEYLKSLQFSKKQKQPNSSQESIVMGSQKMCLINNKSVISDRDLENLLPKPEVIKVEIDVAPKVSTQTEIKQSITSNEDLEMEMDQLHFDDCSNQDFLEDVSVPEQTENNAVEMSAPDQAEDTKVVIGEELSNGWVTNENVDLFQNNIHVDSSTLPLCKNKNGDDVLKFYWLDAYEDVFKQPGVVYLFGKVFLESAKTYVSCCVSVKNIDRQIFILPRVNKYDVKNNCSTTDPVTLTDVYKEFNEKIANPNKIMNFKSRKVTKKYAFDLKDVPAESDYLEVKYPATCVKLSNELSGETFSRIFGTNTSTLELFLLERKIKGPCWLEVKNPHPSRVSFSWTKVEAVCVKPDEVTISQGTESPPPLVIMCLDVRTCIVTKTMQSEVVMIGCLVHDKYYIDKPAPDPSFRSHFCAFTRPTGQTWPLDMKHLLKNYKSTQLHQHESERSLLTFFLTKMFVIDPDVVIGHDLYGFTLNTILHRIEHHKVPHWSRLGKLKRAVIPQTKGKHSDKNIICGRLVCDVNISARELIRARSYDLDTLCKQILHVEDNVRQDYTSEEIKEMYNKTPTIFSLISSTMRDSSFILRLMNELNVLPLALQITSIAGNVMSRTLLGGRSERNEYLLLHAFTENNFIVPDKVYGKRKTNVGIEELDVEVVNNKKKPQYAGGLVLEPKKGFYDKLILLMDFNSLYPSIIQEYNICFTTVTRCDDDEEEPGVPNPNLPPGILPHEIRKLVERRREVKVLMKKDLSPELRLQYNIRQLALKLTANSMYGCLGFSHSRFYAKPLAALVTSKGREILMNTRDVVQKMNFEVIYGDTDSIMINTNCLDYDDVFKIGHKIKQEINKLYKHVELEVDGVFKYMLLLKKKKYAAVSLTKKQNGELVSTQEHKGLDIVRRDWSQLSAEVGRHVLNQILSDMNPDDRISNIREHLEKIAQDLRNKIVPVSLLSITKQLAKNPDEYADKKSLPHIQVAARFNTRGGKKLKAGDVVPYVICDDGTNLPATQRAYHVDELKTNENLIIDVNYYLSQQIHPVVSRLCEPIDGADPAFIADCLGLDPSNYKKIINRNNVVVDNEDCDENGGDYSLINDVELFKNCDKFSFQCMNESCKTKIFIDGPLYDNYPVLSKCRNPSCRTSPLEYLPSIQNALHNAARSYIHRLYENWMICEDPACPNRTRRVSTSFLNSFPVCMMCKRGLMYREYRNSDLYYQLKYFEYMFDLKKIKTSMSPQLTEAYKTLNNQMTELLDKSAYRILDFRKIFKFRLNDKNKLKLNEKQLAIMSSQKKWQNL